MKNDDHDHDHDRDFKNDDDHHDHDRDFKNDDHDPDLHKDDEEPDTKQLYPRNLFLFSTLYVSLVFFSSFHCICCTYHRHILQICLFCLIVRKISDHVQCQKTLMIHFDTLVGSKILLM